MFINYNLPVIKEPSLLSAHAVPKGRYFSFLDETDTYICTNDHYIASRRIENQLFVEIKCNFDKNWSFNLQNSKTVFWLVFQFLGTSSIADKKNSILNNQQYLGFINELNEIHFLSKAGKIWMVLIGMEIENKELLAREWKRFMPKSDRTFHLFSVIKTAYRNNRILEQIQRIKDSPFVLGYKLQYQVVLLMDTYHGDLQELSRSAEHENISLFHRAKDYIIEHYLDEDIDIKLMARELLTSERTLYRIFKENGLTVNSAIQAIRIYKGRELLQRTDDSVDMIAFQLHFSSAKYFIKQYVKYFGRTPAKERMLMDKYPLPDFNRSSEMD